MSIKTETSNDGGNFSIIEYDDDRHRRVIKLRQNGSVSIGSQFRLEESEHWNWYQDEGATLSAAEMAQLIEVINARGNR